jgi:hypothetical protein
VLAAATPTAADAGIVRGIAPQRRHYVVSIVSSLGKRHAPTAPRATARRMSALGEAIDAALVPWPEGLA